MTAEGVKETVDGVEEKEIQYAPGVYGKAVLDLAKAIGHKFARFSGNIRGGDGRIQAALDDSGDWHFYYGT